MLAALMLGYSLAETWPWVVKENLLALGLLATVGLSAALGYAFARRAPQVLSSSLKINFHRGFFARGFFLVGMTALGAMYYNYRETRAEIPLELRAPREAIIIIEPRQEFALNPESGREAGLGIVRGIIPAPLGRGSHKMHSAVVRSESASQATSLESAGQNAAPAPLPTLDPWERAEGLETQHLLGQRINYSVRWGLQDPLVKGSWVKMRGVLAPNEKSTGDMGFADYLERSHIAWSLTRGEAEKIVKPAGGFDAVIHGLRRNAIGVLHRRFAKEDSGLLPAMVIGEKAELTREQKENFVRSGTMHLVAVSGLNVMAVAIVLWVLVRLTGLPRLLQAGLVVGLLGVYSLVAGAGPSVLRAWGMVALAMLAWGMRRPINLWAVIVLAATLSLIIHPLSFLHAGWRLSFVVVAGLILGMGTLERCGVLQNLQANGPWWKRLPGVLAHTCVASLVAGITVAPLTAAYWGLAQPLGFLLNAAAVTLASLVTLLGTVSWVTAWLPYISAILNEAAYGLLAVIDWAMKGYLQLPGAVLDARVIKSTGIEIWGTLGLLAIFYGLSRWGWGKLKNKPAGSRKQYCF